MSIVDLYASEARFKTAQLEYNNLMRTMQHTCLGKDKASTNCLRAAQLNADMQSEIIKMSGLVKTVDPVLPGQPSVQAYLAKVQKLSKELSDEYAALMNNPAKLQDSETISRMQRANLIVWVVITICVSLMVIL